MNPESLFALVDGKLLPLESQNELPAELLRALPNDLDAVLGQDSLAIGSWDEQAADGPLVLALNRAGQLVSLIAVSPDHVAALPQTLSSMDHWLASLDLRSMGDLSGNAVVFYEGLLDLSPESSIVLSPRRQYVLVTALDYLDLAPIESVLPGADIQVRYVDVLLAPGTPAIFRSRTSDVARSAPSSTSEAGEQGPSASTFAPVALPRMPENPSPEIPEDIAPLLVDLDVELDVDLPDLDEPEEPSVSISAAPVVHLDDVEPLEVPAPPVPPAPPPAFEFGDTDLDITEPNPFFDIDLTRPEDDVLKDEPPPPLVQGATYDLDQLPLLFNATTDTLESISNELFAVDDSIVVVVELPEGRRGTPFEDRRKFRWDTSLERILLLNDHSETLDGRRRTVHLFVEAARFGEYALYVGELRRTAFQTQVEQKAETAWFSISPSLPHDLYRMLRKGRLPEHESTAAAI